MRRLRVLAVCLSLASAARAQTQLSCSTIQGASNYGTDLSVCRMPDDSTLKCSQDKAGMSHCQVEHANGFVSDTSSGGEGPIPMIITAIGEHRAHTAEKNLRSAAELQVKNFVLTSDFIALVKAIALNSSPADEKATAEWEKLQKSLEQERDFATKVASWNDHQKQGDWRFYENHKLWREIHDLSLAGMCNVRKMAQLFTVVIRGNLAKMSPEQLTQVERSHLDPPKDVVQALIATESDVNSLGDDCSSKEALKIMESLPRQQSR